MKKQTLYLSVVLFIIAVLSSQDIFGGVWADPNSFEITTKEGGVETRTLTIGNSGAVGLNYLIRTRGVHSEELVLEKAGDTDVITSSIPPNYDFTVAEDVPYKAGELIVRFGNKITGRRVGLSKKLQTLTALGAAVKRDFQLVPGLSVVSLPAGMTVESALKEFNQSEDILYAQPNYEVRALSTFPNDTRFNELWGMHNTGQSGGTAHADIDAPEAWDITTGSGEIIVAVIDTGVDYTHPDLAANMWVNQAEYYGTSGVDDDGNGYIDDIYGYDFCNNDGNPMDDHYHGTHCAGTIGAIGNNGQGVAGVCWHVKVMAIKFLNSGGSGYTDDAIASVQYSILMGAKLSSNSWGGGGYSQGLKDAIDAAGAAGMLFVAAAGNDGGNNDTYSHYPSNYTSESLISVMATDKYDNKSSFSNYGPVSVDIGAPGSDILSCQPGNRYQYLSGTSMATPHISGACALVWSMNPALSNTEVKDILLQTVDKTLTGKCVSEGRLNLYNAILETKSAWITVEPEEGSIQPGDSNELSVIFDATNLTPGTYQAEILVLSNDPLSPMTIPVTMTVMIDDLQVSPADGFESEGTEGGPFTPVSKKYTLANIGAEAVNWEAIETANWLRTEPATGVLEPMETIEVSVSIDTDANVLEPNIYNTTLIFKNLDSNSVKQRPATLTVKPPDYFTESFNANNDLKNVILTFSPDGSIAYYEACHKKTSGFLTDPNGGTNVTIGDDDFVQVILSDNKHFSFYGTYYDRFYIGSNGYITFDSGDTEFSGTLGNHFNLPRISGLFTDLSPLNSQNISYKQMDDRIAVTFKNIPVFGDKTKLSSFQIEMFFVDGTICISYLNIDAGSFVAGLSQGRGLPPTFFTESDLSKYPRCWPCGDMDRDYAVNFEDFALFAYHWLENNCEIPFWCGKSDFDLSGITDIKDVAMFLENWLLNERLQPISHWKFDEGSGTIAYDSAGSNDGTLVNSPTWITGQINSALHFNGTNQYINIPNNSTQQITTNQITLSAWITLDANVGNTQKKIICKQMNENTTWALIIFGSGYGGSTGNQVIFHDSSGSHYRTCLSPTHLGTGQWYHVAATDNAGKVKIYINGQLDSSFDNGYGIPSNIDAPIVIAKTNPSSTYFFDGLIDDVRIYNRALFGTEIQQIYNEGATP